MPSKQYNEADAAETPPLLDVINKIEAALMPIIDKGTDIESGYEICPSRKWGGAELHMMIGGAEYRIQITTEGPFDETMLERRSDESEV